MDHHERALTLENCEDLESIYATAAKRGQTSVPLNAEDDVDFHFVCFVKSNKSGRVYELDGDRKQPIDKGITLASGDDMLSKVGMGIIREFIQREGKDGCFNLMALVPTAE